MAIDRVKDSRDLDEFIRFPWTVYKNEANWVPPLIDEMRFLLGEDNPFHHHAETALFLAREGKEITGRVAAIIDRNHINYHSEQAGFFGFFECLPDFHVAEGLVDAVQDWLRERSIEVMRGPVDLSTNDACGFLVEGHDAPPQFMMPYSPPRYLDYMEDCGLTKAMDLFAYTTAIEDVTSIGRIERTVTAVKRKLPGLSVRSVDKKRFADELNIIKDIYNSAWSRNWGFVPRTDEEIESLAGRLRPFIVPDLVLIAEVAGETAGFLMMMPDHNATLHRMDGRMGMLGRLQLRWFDRNARHVRVMTLGIKEYFRRKGIEALLYLEAFRAAERRGFTHAEMSWVSEDNLLMQRGCELMGGRITKRYRVFEKRL